MPPAGPHLIPASAVSEFLAGSYFTKALRHATTLESRESLVAHGVQINRNKSTFGTGVRGFYLSGPDGDEFFPNRPVKVSVAVRSERPPIGDLSTISRTLSPLANAHLAGSTILQQRSHSQADAWRAAALTLGYDSVVLTSHPAMPPTMVVALDSAKTRVVVPDAVPRL
jgi:hypothetical protein